MSNSLVTFLASFLIWVLFAGLFVLWFIDGRIKKEQVIHAILAGLLAYVITDIIKTTIPTIRPFVIDGKDILTFTMPQNGAFPSTHTALAFALGVTIFLHDKRAGVPYLLLALAIGIARIVANVHYPIDIVGGAIIGSVIALFIEKTHLFKLLRRG